MKKAILPMLLLGVVMLGSCVKTKKDILKPGDPTFNFTFTPAGGSDVKVSNTDCNQIEAQGVTADGKTSVTISGWDGGGAGIIQINLVVQGDHVGIYAQHPMAAFSGTSTKLSSELPYATRDEDIVSIELTKLEAKGGRIEGTLNGTCLHVISYNPTVTEELQVKGSFNIPHTY